MKVHSPSNCVESQYAWASVKGPGHTLHHIPNQDASCVLEFKKGIIFVVSDGIGSKKHSDIGSKAVVSAVCDAVKKWSEFPNAGTSDLLRLIHIYWELYIQPYDRDSCAATCLFTVVLDNNRCVMGQIGDGLILFRLGEDYHVLYESESLYANVTVPISQVKSLNEWAVQDFIIEYEFKMILCSDGVSEDIIEEKRFEYIDFLLSKLSSSKRQRNKNNKLKTMLKNWDNPRNMDDKSLVIYHRKVLVACEGK